MKRQTLIKVLIAIGLGAQVLGLGPSIVSQCYAQDNEKGPTPIVGPKAPVWVALGGKFQRGLSVVTDSTSITVFGVGTDNALSTVRSENKGKNWGLIVGHGGDNVRTAPACVNELNSTFRCFWVFGSSLFSRLVTASGNGDAPYVLIGEKNLTLNAPSAVGNAAFAHGYPDDALWFASNASGTPKVKWESMGGELKGAPSCVSQIAAVTGGGFALPYPVIGCYVVGKNDDAVWGNIVIDLGLKSQKFVGWKKVGGLAMGGVSAFQRDTFGRAILAVRGTDSTLWIAHEVKPTGEWQWKNYPGEISSVPACSLNYCFAILPDGQLGFLDLTGQP